MPFIDRIVRGFHGTNKKRALEAVGEQKLRPSQNTYDWLGHGLYFWEESYSRARQWSEQKYGEEASVIQARVKLGRCIDLLDTNWGPAVKQAYQRVVRDFNLRGKNLPENRGSYRLLDCLIMNELAGRMFSADTVRAAFLEGEPAYPTSIFVGLAHIQLVVRNAKLIIAPLEICEA